MKSPQPANQFTPSKQEAFDTLIAVAKAAIDETAPLPPPAGRDAKGQFTRGNPGGPGNPFARQAAKLRSALVHTVTEADMQDIAEALTLQAKRGNLAAIKLLFLYVLGKPAQTVNPDTLDLEEWQQLFRPIPQIMKELPEAMMSLPVETSNDRVETTQQAVRDTLALPQQEFEKVDNAIAKNDSERQESTEDERRAASQEEAAPSPNGEGEQAKTAAGPSPNGGFGRTGALLWLAKIAATARLAHDRNGGCT